MYNSNKKERFTAEQAKEYLKKIEETNIKAQARWYYSKKKDIVKTAEFHHNILRRRVVLEKYEYFECGNDFYIFSYDTEKLLLNCYKNEYIKPIFYIRVKNKETIFFNIEKQKKELLKLNIESYEKKNEQEKKAINFLESIRVDDIFYSSWGYEQTNIDFYQVISKKQKTVILRALKGIITDYTGNMTGAKIAQKNDFKDEILIKKIVKNDYIKLSSYEYLKKWDGVAKRFTNYA